MKYIYRILGLISVAIGYVGIFVPGLPTTTFVILAGWLFAKSSPKFNRWLHAHPLFGKYLTDWEERRVYPTRGKYAMMGAMTVSTVILYFTVSFKAAGLLALFSAVISVWAWRYPGSVEEYDRRITKGEKIGWLR